MDIRTAITAATKKIHVLVVVAIITIIVTTPSLSFAAATAD